MLKMIVDQVPEGLGEYYKQNEDGKFVLDVEDAVHMTVFDTEVTRLNNEVKSAKAKVDEFRDTNTTYKQQLEKISETGKVDKEAIELATKSIKDNLLNTKTELDTLKTKYQQAQEQLQQVVLTDQVRSVALSSNYGVEETAVDDIVMRAKNVFKVEDGKLIAKETSLDSEGNPYTLNKWMEDLPNVAPHYFKASKGTGAKRNNVNGTETRELSKEDKISEGLKALRNK